MKFSCHQFLLLFFFFEGLPFFAGITATGAALKLALELLQDRRPNALTNVIVLTDGFRCECNLNFILIKFSKHQKN